MGVGVGYGVQSSGRVVHGGCQNQFVGDTDEGWIRSEERGAALDLTIWAECGRLPSAAVVSVAEAMIKGVLVEVMMEVMVKWKRGRR